jgi:hypothetical protein
VLGGWSVVWVTPGVRPWVVGDDVGWDGDDAQPARKQAATAIRARRRIVMTQL